MTIEPQDIRTTFGQPFKPLWPVPPLAAIRQAHELKDAILSTPFSDQWGGKLLSFCQEAIAGRMKSHALVVDRQIARLPNLANASLIKGNTTERETAGPNRIKVLRCLTDEPQRATDVGAKTGISRITVRRHFEWARDRGFAEVQIFTNKAALAKITEAGKAELAAMR
jgi:hypothetical protein